MSELREKIYSGCALLLALPIALLMWAIEPAQVIEDEEQQEEQDEWQARLRK